MPCTAQPLTSILWRTDPHQHSILLLLSTAMRCVHLAADPSTSALPCPSPRRTGRRPACQPRTAPHWQQCAAAQDHPAAAWAALGWHCARLSPHCCCCCCCCPAVHRAQALASSAAPPCITQQQAAVPCMAPAVRMGPGQKRAQQRHSSSTAALSSSAQPGSWAAQPGWGPSSADRLEQAHASAGNSSA